MCIRDSPKVGQLANEVRSGIEALVEERTAAVKAALLDQKLALEKLDVTMPGRAAPVSYTHLNRRERAILRKRR